MPSETKATHHRPTIVRTQDTAARCAAAASTGSWGPDDFLNAEAADCGGRPTPMFHARGADETAKSSDVWPNYLDALELINGAGQAMTAMEDHSQKISSQGVRAYTEGQSGSACRQSADRLTATAARDQRDARCRAGQPARGSRAPRADGAGMVAALSGDHQRGLCKAPRRPAPGGQQPWHGCVAAASAIDGRAELSCPAMTKIISIFLRETWAHACSEALTSRPSYVVSLRVTR